MSCRRVDSLDTVRLAVAGELDMATVPALEAMLVQAQAEASLVVLDLRELKFIDSSGLQLVLAADRRARVAGRRLVVVRGRGQIERLFGLLGIDRELELVDQPPWVVPTAALELAR